MVQVKALEAADAARRKEAAKNADRIKQKGTLDKQRAERAKVSISDIVMQTRCMLCTLHESPAAACQGVLGK